MAILLELAMWNALIDVYVNVSGEFRRFFGVSKCTASTKCRDEIVLNSV
jgi:hypothetical protein